MDERINLLIVEDSKVDAFLLIRELQSNGFEVAFERVQTASELKSALSKGAWDAVLSDYDLPSFSAPEALEIVHQSGFDLPFIVVSGVIGEETAIIMMRAGAHDYLMKDNLGRLGEALRREIREAHVRQERRQAEKALKVSEERFRLLFERSNDAIFLVETHTGRYLDANKSAEILTGRAIADLKSLTTFDIAPIDAQSRLDQLAKAKETFEFGEVSYIRPDGSSRVALLTMIPVGENLAFGIAHDVTEEKRAGQALERRAQELEGLYRTSLKITAQTDLMPLLQLLVEQAASILDTRMGGLYLMQPGGDSLKLVVSHNLPGNYLGVTLKLGEGFSGKIAQTGQPMMISDYSSWPGRAAVYDSAPFKRVLGVPLRVKERVIGVINVTDDLQTGEYTPEEVRLLNLFADQAAIAVENARLLAALQRELLERKQAEESLLSTKTFLDHVLKAVPLGISVFNIKTWKMEFANAINTNFSGMTIEQFNSATPETLWEKIHPDDRQRRTDFMKSLPALSEGQGSEIEYRRQDLQGEWRWYHYRYFVFERAADGSIRKLLSVVEDVTERKHAEEALQENMVQLQDAHQRLRFHVNRMPLGFIVLNKDSIITEWNPAAETIFGWTSAEAIGQHDFLVVPLDVQPHVSRIWAELPNGNEQSGYSVNENITKDGRRIICEWHNAPLRDPDRNIIGFLSMCNDITERKRSEQALERQLKELSLLHNLALAGIKMNTLDDLVGFVTHEVGRSFQLDSFGVLFLDDKSNQLRLHPSYYGIVEKVPEIVPLDASISGQVATTGKPYRVGNVNADRYYLSVSSKIQSELCVPIKIGEKILGVINAESQHPDYFTEDDERLLMTIAGQMTTAIERIRLFDLERKRRQESETLRQATAAISTTLALNQVLDAILVALQQVVPFDSAAVFLLEGAYLRIVAAYGFENLQNLEGQVLPAESWFFQEIQRTYQPLIITDSQVELHEHSFAWNPDSRTQMLVPLIVRSVVTGCITLHSRAAQAYDQESASMAQTFTHQAAIAIDNARLFEGIQTTLNDLNQAYESTIEGWSRAMDLRDKDTEGHTLRVTQLTMRLAVAMGIGQDELIHIRRGALLHDIGKIGVPDPILLKPDSLTADEWVIMRRHPQYALEMISPIAYLCNALDIPYGHHERWDGSGYPRGLKGADIPLAARIFAVADVWDALTTDRPYRSAWTYEETLGYIRSLSGKQFDPQVVQEFLKLMGRQ